MKLILLTLALVFAPSAFAQVPVDRNPHPLPAEKIPVETVSAAVSVAVQKASYPLDKCIFSGEALDDKSVDVVVGGKLVRVCCDKCAAKAKADAAATVQKIDDAVIAAQKPGYPLDTCCATGAKLDDKAVDYVFGTRLVRLANKDAIAVFQKDPKAAMGKLDKAYIAALTKTYRPKTCPISGEPIGHEGSPVDYLYGTTLVRFCCNDCLAEFQKTPEKYIAKVRSAK